MGASTAAAAATRYVDAVNGSDGGTCSSSPGCQTIGYAMGQAANGDVLQLAPGTYVEQVVVNKNVTIQGGGSAQTIVQAPATLAINTAVTPGSGQQQTAIVYVAPGMSAALSDLAVVGPGASTCGSIGYGVFADAADLSVSNVHVGSVRDEPLSGCQNGRGIGYRNGATGTVQDSSIDDFQKTGIVIYDAGTQVAVSGNTITGMLAAPLAQNGIDLWNATATIDNNAISTLRCDDVNVSGCGEFASWSTGILVDSAGPGTALTNNVVSNTDGSVVALYGASAYVLAGNTFNNPRYDNVQVWGAQLDMTSNQLIGGQTGLEVIGYSAPATVRLLGGNIISGASSDGIIGDSYDQPATVQGSQNQFYGNGSGAENLLPTDVTMNLQCNWWGSMSGPYFDSGVAGDPNSNPLGQGNAVSADISYINWANDNITFPCSGTPEQNAPPPTGSAVPVPAGSALAWGGQMGLLLAAAAAGMWRRRPQSDGV
ncbi:MAG TPA: right-handed parallel beta-helix repeat-containing protein [Rhodanobacteraceae bacterium]|nr:right-handed parallel beta-helix repeat-containing protein [Rhodanobacteraceae bacterium]